MDLNQNNTSRSINLMLTPTLFFFNFLAYTDALSLMLMTMAFYYNLVNSRKRLFLFSMLSVFVRQNNIIWLGYLACYRIVLDQKQLFGNDRSILSHAITLVKTILTKKVYILKQFKYQLFLLTLFIGYLYKFNNGRLLFGDVTNHPVSFNPTQILYFALFATLNLPLTIREFLFTWTNVIRRLYYSRHALSTWLFLLSISIVFVDIYTYTFRNSALSIPLLCQTTDTTSFTSTRTSLVSLSSDMGFVSFIVRALCSSSDSSLTAKSNW